MFYNARLAPQLVIYNAKLVIQATLCNLINHNAHFVHILIQVQMLIYVQDVKTQLHFMIQFRKHVLVILV